jgi:hypothetical protein
MAKRKREGQTPQWSKEKEKDRQHNGQKKKRRTDNTMVKRKREGQKTQWPKEKGQKDNNDSLNRKADCATRTPRKPAVKNELLFMFHQWHPLCYSFQKHVIKS